MTQVSYRMAHCVTCLHNDHKKLDMRVIDDDFSRAVVHWSWVGKRDRTGV